MVTAPCWENSAAPLLAHDLGGPILRRSVPAVAFAATLAVVAGRVGVVRPRRVRRRHQAQSGRGKQRGPARPADTLVIGELAVLAGILVKLPQRRVPGRARLSASADLSTMLYSTFRRRSTTAGTYSDLGARLPLIIFAPVIPGAKDSVFAGTGFAFFPLHTRSPPRSRSPSSAGSWPPCRALPSRLRRRTLSWRFVR